jgi:NAD-dependent dihydropyrimidine dehydrogenase PreA subunit
MISDISSTKCTGCGICIERCPLDALRLNSSGKAYIAYPEDCMTCYVCEISCPVGAIYVHPFKEELPPAITMPES